MAKLFIFDISNIIYFKNKAQEVNISRNLIENEEKLQFYNINLFIIDLPTFERDSTKDIFHISLKYMNLNRVMKTLF